MPPITHIKMHWVSCCAWLIATLSLQTSSVIADNQVTQIPFANTSAGSVGLGAGLRFGTSAYKFVETISSLENDNNADLVPLYLYEGKYLYSHGTRAGLRLYNQESKINVITQYRFDRLESSSHEFYDSINDRRQTLESGLAASTPLWGGELSASWVADTLDRHNGQEIDLTYRFNIQASRFNFTPYISGIYQNKNLVNYYYGVSQEEERADLPMYSATEAYLARAGLNSSIQVFNNWHIFANISYEWLDETIINSPLTDKHALSKIYLGFSYNFGNAWAPEAVEKKQLDTQYWSWRMHAGYTAQETFHKVHRGHVKTNEDVDTYLAGITLGRLLKAGDRADFWLKGSINRRLENNLQDNLNEYNLYVMSMGTGYKGWTNKELFRYGFGFGFSYADEIPIVEVIKQESRGKNNARFLNYLEAQFDVPLRNFFSAEAVSHCYAGLSIIHRSGIFATSDILGNVSGGSDVLAGHIECKR